MKLSTKRLVIMAALEQSLGQMLTQLSNDVLLKLLEYVQEGAIQETPELQLEIETLIEEFFVAFLVALILTAGRLGEERAKNAIEEIVPALRRAGLMEDATELTRVAFGYKAKVEKTVLTNKWTEDGRTLNVRIKTLKRGTQKMVREMIKQAAREGKSVEQVARDIRRYIKPDARLVKQSRKGGYKIKNVPSGSLSYNATRIARTEMAQVYRTATIEFYKDKDYVKGWGWYLSNRHPKTDECNTYANTRCDSYLDLPMAHPNCLCDVRPILYTEDELSRR